MVWLRRMSKIMDSDQFSIGLIDALQNDDVITKFSQMFSKSLKEETDSSRQEIGTLRNALKGRDAKITKLEKDVVDLQDKFDDQEQYSRRNTLCISNIPEKQFEDTTVMALKLFNDKRKTAIYIIILVARLFVCVFVCLCVCSRTPPRSLGGLTSFFGKMFSTCPGLI